MRPDKDMKRERENAEMACIHDYRKKSVHKFVFTHIVFVKLVKNFFASLPSASILLNLSLSFAPYDSLWLLCSVTGFVLFLCRFLLQGSSVLYQSDANSTELK